MRASLLLPLLLLGACNGSAVTETLGLGRHAAPDEFDVVSRPPLTVPKEFYLIPPEDGSPPPLGGKTAPEDARRMVTGLEASTNDMTLEQAETGLADTAAPVVQSGELSTTGESAFLRRAGVDKADPKVRSEISAENRSPEKLKEPSFLDKIRGKTSEEPVVDASGEQARIQANKKEGKKVTEGETVTDDPANKSTLERLFD